MLYFTITIGSFLLVLGTLLPILNPLYVTPVFWTMTAGATKELRRLIARKVGIYSFVILLISALFGNVFLKMFGITIPIVQLAGGLIVVHAGWKLLNAEDPDSGHHEKLADDFNIDKVKMKASTFYPLTFPLTAGPGSIAAAITVGASLKGSSGSTEQVFAVFGIILGCFTIGFLLYMANRFAVRIMTKMGQTGMAVVMRLVAFLLICIGIQIMWNGLFQLIVSIPFVSRA
ncbi:antibiotic resistance protein [Oligella sp. HMSC05A10]|uniref:MarC family protein n=1 Tax=Oligella TaxID=90243 RepID=UPI0008A59B7F|nr:MULTISPECIES: MarC family protein [Oligella]MDK6203405.1 MarC family protein [Oligella urethralis]OFS84652.1 antibiotic resistance protein [Oligella sp. HMSC05A10]OFV47902.1 antibiotic resistance protein [Oligella sp. HMSC09E12]PMC17860.1 antibiotic resistance protein [Oligella urethralis]SUA58588.1 inner membrane protein [Oligella urethralis]